MGIGIVTDSGRKGLFRTQLRFDRKYLWRIANITQIDNVRTYRWKEIRINRIFGMFQESVNIAWAVKDKSNIKKFVVITIRKDKAKYCKGCRVIWIFL